MNTTNEDAFAYLDTLIERAKHPTILDRFAQPYRLVRRWWDSGVFDFKHYYQRLRYGVSYRDAWSLDDHLARVIERGVQQLKTYQNSRPMGLAMEEWQAILTQIEEGMHFDQASPLVRKHNWDKIVRGRQLLADHFSDLWD
jgi:hypothetical protein